MKFKRLFYDSTINFRNISKHSLIVAIIVGITSAFVIYSWFYVVREVYRLISIGFDYMPNILSESDRNIYNLFFAFLSLIFGNSIAISFLFSEPQKIISKRNPKRRRLLNDQIFLNFNFAYWFTKIGLTFGVFSMYMEFNFIPYFNVFLVLLLLVLYLETWKTLNQILGKRRWKYLIIHALIMCSISFLMSQIDVINYKKIDALVLKNNPIIDLPYSDFSNVRYGYQDRTINLKLEAIENNEPSIINEYGERFGLNQLAPFIWSEKDRFRPELLDRLIVRISANKNISILHIKQVEAELFAINKYRIVYDVLNDNPLTQRFKNNGIKSIISPSVTKVKQKLYGLQPPPLPVPFSLPREHRFSDTLSIKISGNIKVNDTIIPVEKLANKFKNYVNIDTVFEYEYDSNIEYQQYINVLSSHNKAVDELIRSYYPNDYDIYDLIYLSDKERDEINGYRRKYPINIIEKID